MPTVETLTAADLAELRAVQAGFMPETFEVLRNTATTRDAFNDRVDDWQVVATVRGRIAATNARGQNNEVVTSAMFLSGVSTYDVTLPYDSVIQDQDRLRLTKGEKQFVFQVKPGSFNASFVTALRVTVQLIGAP
jgi:hypothetical protein